MKVSILEKDIQKAAEELLNKLSIPFIRIPDVILKGFFRSKEAKIWHKAQAKKYLGGLPDLVLFDKNNMRYKAIEIKRDKKGVVSPEQKIWKEKLNTVITSGWEETKSEILKFKKGE